MPIFNNAVYQTANGVEDTTPIAVSLSKLFENSCLVTIDRLGKVIYWKNSPTNDCLNPFLIKII